MVLAPHCATHTAGGPAGRGLLPRRAPEPGRPGRPPTAPPAGVRLIVAVSSAATVLYTPIFKKQTLVKNCVVATTIAAAPLAGALAAGAAGPGLHAVLAPSAFLWLGILHREIMMDIQVGPRGTHPGWLAETPALAPRCRRPCLVCKRTCRETCLAAARRRRALCRLCPGIAVAASVDSGYPALCWQHLQDRRGDGAAGVQTLPVVLGPRGALACCLALLAACSALAAHAALRGGGLAWAWAGRPALEAPLRCAALGGVAWVLARNVASTLRVLRSRFGRDEVRRRGARPRTGSARPCALLRKKGLGATSWLPPRGTNWWSAEASMLCILRAGCIAGFAHRLLHGPQHAMRPPPTSLTFLQVSQAISVAMSSVSLGTLLLAVLV